jgi:hypothetical protein
VPSVTPTLEAPVSGLSVGELQQWASLWADLLHVDMVLGARDKFPNTPEHVFTRRALWEGAVIAYGRMASGGPREVTFKQLLTALGAAAQDCHNRVMVWRDKHIAHRVHAARETVTTHAVIDAEQHLIRGMRIRVTPAVGPEEDGDELIPAFKEHVYRLRNLIWEQRFRPLESKVLNEYAGQVEALLKVAARNTLSPPPDRLSFTINPSG